MDVLGFFTLVITGFAACAEFGSYALVHPVLRQLPSAQHIRVEQGLLRTFGRVMPVLMTLCVVLSVSYAVAAKPASVVYWTSALLFTAALLSTLRFNVPINRATGRWNADNLPPDWQQVRNRWEFFQGLRSWLLLIGFLLFCLAFTLNSSSSISTIGQTGPAAGDYYGVVYKGGFLVPILAVMVVLAVAFWWFLRKRRSPR